LEWLRSCRYTERPKDMALYVGVDLAVGRKENNSRFAYVVVGIPAGDKDTYIVDAHRDRLIFPEQVKAIKRLCHVYKPCCVSIENNSYQESMLQLLRTDPETSRLPIIGVPTTGDKQRRIKSMAPLFENGTLRLPVDLPDLEEELLHFPLGFDDLLDATWLALWGIQNRRTEAKIRFADDI
jgi:predicted phage terminase large subunit-like protein